MRSKWIGGLVALGRWFLPAGGTAVRGGVAATVGGVLLFQSVAPVEAATLSIGNSGAPPGGVARVPVLVSQPGGAVAVQFDLLWEANQLAPGGDPEPGSASHQAVASPSTFTPLRVVVYSERNQPLPEGLVVEVPLRVPADAAPGLRMVRLAGVLLADAEGRPLPDVALGSGGVQVLSGSAPVLSDPRLGVDGSFLVTLAGEPGKTYVIETSLDLKVWVAAMTNVAATATRPIVHPGALRGQARFYRAVERP